MAELSFDVVVVGAGPAGSAAARAAAERGVSVLLIDKRAEVGRPVQCAEYVPRLILREVALPRACLAHKTERMRTYLPNGESHTMAAPGYTLHRALFDRHLAVEAARAGADILLRSSAQERTDRGLVVRTGKSQREIVARVIVGADGAHSTVGRWIGQRNTSFVVASQCELVEDAAGAETEVYFSPEYTGGYAWFFPKGTTANVGVGIDFEAPATTDASALLELFLQRLRAAGRIKRTRAIAYTGGFVPVGGLLPGWADNVLLAGDAAGCVHPLTGAGILFAVVSGRLAGEVAAEAIRTGDVSLLPDYQRRRDEAFGGAIARGLAGRARLTAGWSDDATALQGRVLQHWFAIGSQRTCTVEGEPRFIPVEP